MMMWLGVLRCGWVAVGVGSNRWCRRGGSGVWLVLRAGLWYGLWCVRSFLVCVLRAALLISGAWSLACRSSVVCVLRAALLYS